jgi:predicted phosphodiesterase
LVACIVMKTIAFGDIHGNEPALEVCWEQAEKEGYDWIVHTGDVVGYGPFPNECVRFVRERNIAGARGNFDENVGWDGDDSGARDADRAERALAEASFEWTCRQVHLKEKRWLADLPFEVRGDGGGLRIAVFHAGPIDLYSSLRQDMPEPRFHEYGEAARADILVLGHVHHPYHRTVDGRHFVNAGSVGRPRDGNPQTGYAVIESDGEVRVTFRRFPYDVGRTVSAIKERMAPAELGDRLMKGV